ncbi:MAG: OmpA family protein [Muribaculaceae bacterium]|nr:OmpA family protein [Muribaculaceae bacterium]
MKKITLLACACALFLAPAANAQEYTFNRMQDNWFVQATGGVGVMMSYKDAQMKLGKRFMAPKANLFIGKWFSPLLGVRIGGHFEQMKGVAGQSSAIGLRTDMADQMKDGVNYPGQKFNRIGVTGDVLFNVTNWICGYKPGRFYNATVYAGASTSWNFYNDKADGSGSWKYGGQYNGREGWHDRNFALQAGLLNSFALGKHVDLLLDLRFDMIQEHIDGWGRKTWNEYPSVQLGFAYKFGKTEWDEADCPACPDCPPDLTAQLEQLRTKLADANAKIRNLEQQLNDCLNWKKNHVCPDKPGKEAPLATIYYPRGKSYITPVQMEVVDAVADVMNNENDNYKLTGWADNYTGNDEINIKLRHDRVAGVKKALEDKGISGSRLSTETNNANHPDVYGAQSAPLGRCVTIVRNK